MGGSRRETESRTAFTIRRVRLAFQGILRREFVSRGIVRSRVSSEATIPIVPPRARWHRAVAPGAPMRQAGRTPRFGARPAWKNQARRSGSNFPDRALDVIPDRLQRARALLLGRLGGGPDQRFLLPLEGIAADELGVEVVEPIVTLEYASGTWLGRRRCGCWCRRNS